MDNFYLALNLIFDPYVLLIIGAAAVFGLVVGAIPGLTATMATALLIPITFFMDPVPAIGAVISCSAMAIFAGDIPATLLRIPGTPASAAYTDEAFTMAGNGFPERALGISVLCSASGGIAGSIAARIVGTRACRVRAELHLA
jgi:putative tricarboxylic transport membrane protein